jgi:excisionase family DNA binding protein
MSDHHPRWVTVREAAQETRASERTIRRWIEKQAVTIRRIGPSKRVRIDRQSLDLEEDGAEPSC